MRLEIVYHLPTLLWGNWRMTDRLRREGNCPMFTRHSCAVLILATRIHSFIRHSCSIDLYVYAKLSAASGRVADAVQNLHNETFAFSADILTGRQSAAAIRLGRSIDGSRHVLRDRRRHSAQVLLLHRLLVVLLLLLMMRLLLRGRMVVIVVVGLLMLLVYNVLIVGCLVLLMVVLLLMLLVMVLLLRLYRLLLVLVLVLLWLVMMRRRCRVRLSFCN